MKCTISGETCTTPVVCRKSGYIFERRIIEKTLDSNGGCCPITKEPMSVDDLIAIRSPIYSETATVPPKTDVSSSLQHVQNEWDARSIELANLKSALLQTNKELATALIRCQAAQRVIAKANLQIEKQPQQPLTGESIGGSHNDEATSAQRSGKKRRFDKDASEHTNGDTDAGYVVPDSTELVETKPHSPPGDSIRKVKIDEEKVSAPENDKMPKDMCLRISRLATELMNSRKGRVPSSEWVSSSAVGKMKISNQVPLSSESSVGIESIVLGPDNVGFVGLSDGWVKSVDVKSMELNKGGFQCHGEEEADSVNHLWWSGNLDKRLLWGGKDGSVQVLRWDSWKRLASYEHNTGVVGLQQHAIGDICLIGLKEKWLWRNVESGDIVAHGGVSKDETYASCAIHPDGAIFVTGNNKGNVQLWDIRSNKCVTEMKSEAECGAIEDVDMSERGYYMTTCHDGVVELWDLRKNAVAGLVDVRKQGIDCRRTSMDGMGEYGAGVGNKGWALFAGRKKSKVLNSFTVDPNMELSGAVTWGANGHELFVGSKTDGAHPSLVKITVA